MSNSVDTMKNFFNVLKLYAYDADADGVAVLDHAIRTTTHFAGLQDAVNHFVYDIANVTATAGATQSLLQNCGIVIGGDYDFSVDTGAVSGYNAGMGTVKDAQSIVPESGTLDNVPLPAVNDSTVHSYTGADGNTFSYTVTYPNDYLEVFDFSTSQPTYLQAGQTYSTVERISGKTLTYTGEEHASSVLTMLKGLENYWLDAAAKLAYDSFGVDLDGKNIIVRFCVNSPQNFSAATGPLPLTENADAVEPVPADYISVMINATMFTNLDASDPNGNTYNANSGGCRYLDRVIAHEMVHAVMIGAGTMKENMPQFFTEGVAELVQGLDDYDGKNRQYLVGFAEDPSRLAAALEFREGTGTNEAYPAGEMFLRYLCQQSLPTNVAIGTGTPELFGFTAGEEILSGVSTGSQINFASDITSSSVAGDDMFISTSGGMLIVRDARNKVLNLANATGTVTARAYMSAEAGTVDGRGYGEREFLTGADNADNSIIAGDGGCQLWGGSYGDDELFGGAGADNFVAGVGCGNDTIYNANSNDIINLSATTLDQITGANVTSSGVSLTFSDGSTLAVAGNVGATFALADGSTYIADQSTGQFNRTN
ncbi:MAG: hypothetical protein IJ774_02260 [Selenomonadaceae bacterium]|nr:hypothetical protein [Selenomonadaceae bacterium]